MSTPKEIFINSCVDRLSENLLTIQPESCELFPLSDVANLRIRLRLLKEYKALLNMEIDLMNYGITDTMMNSDSKGTK